MLVKMSEIDRPTFGTLKYLTKVAPHPIQKEPWLIDPWAHSLLSDLLGSSPVEEFGMYTRSFYSLSGHYEHLWKYDRPILPKPNDPDLDLAIAHTRKIFSLTPKVKPISWNRLRDIPFIPSSGAGYGYIGKKGDPGNLDKAIRRAVSSLYWWEDTKLGRTNRPFRFRPDLAWSRTQLGTFESPKIRNVWGTAFENILLEGITAAPLIARYAEKAEPMVIGQNMYKRLPDIIHKALDGEGHPQYGIGIDIKSFDSSLQPWLMHTAFDIIEDNLDFQGYYDWLSFQYSREHFITRPVVMPDGRMWLKRLGLPSGSYFTQLVGSICNHIGISYAQLKTYAQFFKTWVLGDDSLFGLPEKLGFPDLDSFAMWLAVLGLLMHPDKCTVAVRPDHLDFLGHCARGTSITREAADMLRLALYPEYPVTSPAQSYARIKGLLLDSGLTSWPIVNLMDYATIKFRELDLPEDPEFGTEGANWLRTVMNSKLTPSNVNIIKAWLVT